MSLVLDNKVKRRRQILPEEKLDYIGVRLEIIANTSPATRFYHLISKNRYKITETSPI
jgi:hypothetical protein